MDTLNTALDILNTLPMRGILSLVIGTTIAFRTAFFVIQALSMQALSKEPTPPPANFSYNVTSIQPCYDDDYEDEDEDEDDFGGTCNSCGAPLTAKTCAYCGVRQK